VDAPVTPSLVLLRQPEDQRGDSFGDGWSAGPAVRVGSAPGDEVPVPTEQHCRLDKEAPETGAGEQSCKSGQNCPVGRLQEWSMDLAPENRHLLAKHDDLDGRCGCD